MQLEAVELERMKLGAADLLGKNSVILDLLAELCDDVYPAEVTPVLSPTPKGCEASPLFLTAGRSFASVVVLYRY